MNNKKVICAGILVVAMFLLTSIPVNATDTDLKAAQQQTVPGTQYWEEPYSFPATLPTGTSSLTCVVKLKGASLWNGIIYDEGFAIYVMKKTDGVPHTWHFDATISIQWRAGGVIETQTIHPSSEWNMYLPLGFRIQPGGSYPFQPFYKIHLSATVTKDIGANEQFEIDLYGFYYFYDNIISVSNISPLQQQSVIMG